MDLSVFTLTSLLLSASSLLCSRKRRVGVSSSGPSCLKTDQIKCRADSKTFIRAPMLLSSERTRFGS